MNVKIDRSRYGYVYKITNLINGKTYVGQRKIVRDKTWEDYYGSGKLIKQAITKYGKENFFERTYILCGQPRRTIRIGI